MIKRYFYTDPLAAAWMAKHFGVKVHCPVWKGDGVREQSNLPVPLWVFGRIIDATSRKSLGVDRFTVAEESVPVFVPQVGDFVVCRWPLHKDHFRRQVHGWVTTIEENIDERTVWVRSDNYCSADEDAQFDVSEVQIIQRNGLAFHWPEEETV